MSNSPSLKDALIGNYQYVTNVVNFSLKSIIDRNRNRHRRILKGLQASTIVLKHYHN